MPEAVAAAAVEAIFAEAFIALTAAEIAAATALVQQVAFTAASLSYSSYSKKQQQRKARNSYNNSLQDREQMLVTAIAPRRVVYGRDKVSGPITYWESTGTNKEFLHLIIPLAAHECDAIETIYFNDVALPEPDVNGDIVSGEFCQITYKFEQESHTPSAGGVVTLAYNASGIISALSGTTEFPVSVTGYGHTAGSNQVTGLPTGVGSILISYDRPLPVPSVRIKRYLGGAAQVAAPDLVAASAGGWTNAHVGKGICYLYVRLRYDIEVFGQVGLPNISAIVRGKKVFDPRSNTTAWTENAALIAADRLRDAEFGLAATLAQIPSTELTAAANVCDEPVQLNLAGATQPRYTFSGSFTTDAPAQDSLGDLAAAMAGSIVWSQGRWLVRPGIYRTPAPAIGPDDLANESIAITPKASRSALFNAVRVSYRDPAQNWAEVQAPLVTNPTYQAQDGGLQMVQDLRLPMACDALRAQRLGKIMLERARQAMAVSITTNLRAYDLAPTDTVPLALERYGWGSGKVFEVEERTWGGGLEINYLLRESAPEIYAWNYGEATTVDLAPNTELPSPYTAPAAPTGLAVDSGLAHTVRLSDGTVISRALVTWAASTEQFVLDGGSVQVEWKPAEASTWQPAEALRGAATSVYVSPIPDGRPITLRARFSNASGRSSPWQYAAHTAERRAAILPLAGALWVVGTSGVQGAPPIQFTPVTPDPESAIILNQGPDGQSQAIWQCTSIDGPVDGDGGWNTSEFAINPLQPYRFEQWVYLAGNTSGDVFMGCGLSTVENLAGGVNANPYFVGLSRASLQLGRWYLMVGYVYPSGYTGPPVTNGGVWDGVTGQKIAAGTDFKWRAGQATTWQRSFMFYASPGAEQYYSQPIVRLLDGSEPGISGILSAAALGRATAAIADAAAALAAASAAQATADGKIDTFWQPTAPGTAAEGDIWFDTDDGAKQYRYTSGAWVLAADTRIAQAIIDAADAKATADGKIDTFWQPTAPGTAAEGDIWFDTDDGAKQYRYTSGAWVLAADTRIGQAISAASDAQATADGKVTTFWQASAPGASAEGDLWFDTDDGAKQYRYTSGAWVLAADTRIGQAISDASDAQATADGKVTTFVQDATPTPEGVGDLWFRPADGYKAARWSGSAWVAWQVGTDAIAPNTATEVYANTPGAAVTVTGLMHTPRGFNSGWTTLLASITFTPGASGVANVFFDGSGELTSPTGDAVEWSIQDQGGAWDGWKTVFASPPGASLFKFGMGTTRKFSVTGGVSYTIAAYASKLNAGDTFTVKNHELRVEVIKL